MTTALPVCFKPNTETLALAQKLYADYHVSRNLQRLTWPALDQAVKDAWIRAAVAMLLANHDRTRMDWLARMHVEVRTPLLYGSRELFLCCPEPEEGMDEKPSDIRDKIDQAMKRSKQ